MFNVVIVDDEISAINNLKWELENFSEDIKVIDSFTSPNDAIHGINYLKPDCVFLDIEMPGMDGFSLLSKLSFKGFHLIITTAYENYAIRAFRENAIDYLLKPIDIDDLNETIERIKNRGKPEDITDKIHEILDNKIQSVTQTGRISIHTSGKVFFKQKDEIIYLKSNNNYTDIFLSEGKKLLISKNLKQVESMFNDVNFIRVHHSYIINSIHINEYIKSDAVFILSDGTHIPVSRSYRNNLKDILNMY